MMATNEPVIARMAMSLFIAYNSFAYYQGNILLVGVKTYLWPISIQVLLYCTTVMDLIRQEKDAIRICVYV